MSRPSIIGTQGRAHATVAAACTIVTTALALTLGLVGCGEEVEASPPAVPSGALTVEYSATDLDAGWDLSLASQIIFSDGAARFEGTGASAKGSVVTIKSAGTYVVSGTSTEGQVVVDLKKNDVVKLVLNDVDLACTTSAPISVENADKVVITLAQGTDNRVTGKAPAESATDSSDEPDGAIFSRSDLTLNGTGSLTVTAEQTHGISSKDDLKIVSGTIAVTAARDGLRGRDCIGVKDGVITVEAGSDGLQSNNDVDPDRGRIAISGGELQITAGADGIQARNTLLILGGELSLNTGGGSDAGSQADASERSAKALKSSVGVYVAGGTVTIDSRDDAVNSNGLIQIDGGTITAATGDDGLRANESITVNDGTIDITKAWEGFESSVITINGGTIGVVADDDAFNAVTVRVETLVAEGAPKWTAPPDGSELHLNGGYVTLTAGGDGLDSNGAMYMTGGTFIVTGAPAGMNVAVDYNTEFVATGGFLLAVGPARLAEGPGASSTQNSILIRFKEIQAAGTLLHLESSDGETLVTFKPSRQYQSLVFSSPDIKTGSTYDLYLGGSSSGTEKDGIYTGGEYSDGVKYRTLTIESVTTH